MNIYIMFVVNVCHFNQKKFKKSQKKLKKWLTVVKKYAKIGVSIQGESGLVCLVRITHIN